MKSSDMILYMKSCKIFFLDIIPPHPRNSKDRPRPIKVFRAGGGFLQHARALASSADNADLCSELQVCTLICEAVLSHSHGGRPGDGLRDLPLRVGSGPPRHF